MTPSLKRIAQHIDTLFLIFAAIVPMAKALYLLKTKRDRLEVVYLNTTVSATAP